MAVGQSVPSLGGIEFKAYNKKELFKNLCWENLAILSTVNSEFISTANRKIPFKNILNSTLSTIDGQWVLFFLKLKYRKTIQLEKLSGADLIYTLCDIALNHNYRILLLGSTERASRIAQDQLTNRFRDIKISRYTPPFCRYPFPKHVNQSILGEIERIKPEIIIVSLGSPKQEYWMWDNRMELARLGVKLAMGAGGTVEFIAGFQKRAPSFVQNIGFEWLWRLVLEPKRRLRRQITRLPHFFCISLKEILVYRHHMS